MVESDGGSVSIKTFESYFRSCFINKDASVYSYARR